MPAISRDRMLATAGALGVACILATTACYPALPGVGGSTAAAPRPSTTWSAPSSVADEARQGLTPGDSFPATLAARRNALTTTDLVSLALERDPETRASWYAAQAAAANYGTARSALFPDIVGSIAANRLKTAATSGRVSVEQTTYGPSLSLSWLLLDFGGRAGAIDAARDQATMANLTHNAVIADVVRRTVQGYFAYVGARALLDAERTSLDEANVNLAASEDRRSVGVATIAEVLQARTAVAQARLSMQQADGALASARGALAMLIGLSPTASFDVDTTEANAPVVPIADAVDSLITRGLLNRPDLAAERALVDTRNAQARASRSQFLPSLSATGTTGTVWVHNGVSNAQSYNFGLALSIPIFNGFGWEYAARAAALTAASETERLRTMQRDVALEVFQTYQQVRTATQSVATAEDLFTSASAATDAARARYREGVGSVLELLTAEQSLADARAQRIASRVAWHTALVQLAHDAGLLQTNGTTPLRTAPTSGGN